MSINKRSYLGTTPVALGIKDAIHVAIVSVRAGAAMEPGAHIKLNEDREAVPSTPQDAFGVANPYLTETIERGQNIWALMKMEEIPNVTHHWDHTELNFEPPGDFKQNEYMEQYATELGVTYKQLMDACKCKVNDGNSSIYQGSLSKAKLDKIQDNIDSDIWYTWAEEVGYEFDNIGSECCPEHDYPDTRLFEYVGK